MRKLPFHAAVEGLERREILSGIHPAAGSGLELALKARGHAQPIALQASPQGAYQTFSILRGKSNALGHFTGQLAISYAPNQFDVNDAQAVLVAQGGDELFLTLKGSFEVPRVGDLGTPGNFTFDVDGGTGLFAGAVGHGQVGIVRNLEIGYSRFTLHGSVHTG